jgi:hypothetical protein
MSIFYMTDSHGFHRLDHVSVDAAMDALEALVESDGGYGFIGCKGAHGNGLLTWNKGEPWRERARAFLTSAKDGAA